MGGMGSGNRFRWHTKETIDALRSVDVRWLRREGILHRGAFATISWTRNGQPAGDIQVRTGKDRVVLIYRYRLNGGTDWQDVKEPVEVTWTDCNYGGKRPWFICPGVADGRHCGRRVAILYSAGRYFLCRHCYGLTYQSRNENEHDRLFRKARKIRERLGVHEELTRPIQCKPKGMHRKTFNRLRIQADHATHRANEAYVRRLARMMGKDFAGR